MHHLSPLDMFRNHFSFDFTFCVSMQYLSEEIVVGFHGNTFKIPFSPISPNCPLKVFQGQNNY